MTKPYGAYEDEVVNVAAPPGMAYVGNSKYGEWREDNQGNRFWDWFGPYLFFSTLLHRPYYYNDWNGWRGGYYGQRPYYVFPPAIPVDTVRTHRIQGLDTLVRLGRGKADSKGNLPLCVERAPPLAGEVPAGAEK